MERIVYVAKISKSGKRVYIVVPKHLRDKVKHGKTYKVILEGPLEES